MILEGERVRTREGGLETFQQRQMRQGTKRVSLHISTYPHDMEEEDGRDLGHGLAGVCSLAWT